MCTVAYIPGKTGSILASLRDENPARAVALAPAIYRNNEHSYVMCQDPAGGGTWAGFNDSGSAIALLNGAFDAHKSTPPYRMSRGRIVRSLLESTMPVVEWMLMDMDDIEPYTLIVFTERQLFRLTWDGMQKHRTVLDGRTSHIFSSATLYDARAAQVRRDHFDNWMVMDPPVNRLSLMGFFKSLKDRQNGFIIDRSEQMKTLSMSYMELSADNYCYYYYDLQQYQLHTCSLQTDGMNHLQNTEYNEQ